MLCLLFVHVCCMLGWGAWWWVWSIVVTPTHPLVPWHPGGGKLCRCYSATLHNLLQRHHSATLQTSGGWVGPGGCRGVLSMWTTSTPAPTQTAQYTARHVPASAGPRRARPGRPPGGEHSCGPRGWRGSTFAGCKCKLLATFCRNSESCGKL